VNDSAGAESVGAESVGAEPVGAESVGAESVGAEPVGAEPVGGSAQPLRVALLGCGSVGSQVVRLLSANADDLRARIGAPVELIGVAVRRIDALREVEVPAGLLTTDAVGLVSRDDVDVVIELIGGIEPARTLILTALRRGAAVVTGNKALLAEDGPTLFEAADAAAADLYFEASVAAAIPILRPLRESLAGDAVTRVLGIVNGTTNFILDKMDTQGAGYGETLTQAQELGYAEADPTADVEGFDAAAKAAILASLAFHTRVSAADVHREGIVEVSSADVKSAREMGSVVKLLAICELRPHAGGEDAVSVRVHPAMIPRSHPLASVHGAFNAVFVEAESAGQLMFYGPGAGGAPTASAILGDLVTVGRNRLAGARGPGESAYADRKVLPMGETVTRYHVAIDVDDKAGVLAAVATAFAEHGVSIQTVRQEGRGADAQLVVVSHAATDAQLSATVERLREMSIVHDVNSVMRVEGVEE
jgi:homoserine dehydrogenase